MPLPFAAPLLKKVFGAGSRVALRAIRKAAVRTVRKVGQFLVFQATKRIARMGLKYRGRWDDLVEDWFPMPDPVEEDRWSVDDLVRVLDAVDPDRIKEALQESTNGRVAVNGLTVTLLQSMTELVGGVAIATATATVLVEKAQRLSEWLERLPATLESLLFLDTTPLITLIGEIIDDLPGIVGDLFTLATAVAEQGSRTLEGLENLKIPVDIPGEVLSKVEEAIAIGDQFVNEILNTR